MDAEIFLKNRISFLSGEVIFHEKDKQYGKRMMAQVKICQQLLAMIRADVKLLEGQRRYLKGAVAALAERMASNSLQDLEAHLALGQLVLVVHSFG